MSQLALEFDDMGGPQNVAECPAPGIYHDIGFDAYRAWRAVNSGVIKWGRVSPKHFAAALDGRIASDDTRSRKLGRAIHCAVLEPDEFPTRFLPSGKCAAEIKSGQREGQRCGAEGRTFDGVRWLCGSHDRGVESVVTREVIAADEYDRALKVRQALRGHVANQVLRRSGFSEASMVWEYQGLTCKGRVDRYADGKRPVIIDVKKCRVGHGTQDECHRAILNYEYHLQASLYVNGVETLTGRRPEFIWVFVEDNEPFDVQVIPASKEDLTIGWHEVRQSIGSYLRAIKDGEPHGYIYSAETIKPGGLPLWYLKQCHQAGILDGDEDGGDERRDRAGEDWGTDTSEASEPRGGTGHEEAGRHPAAVASDG